MLSNLLQMERLLKKRFIDPQMTFPPPNFSNTNKYFSNLMPTSTVASTFVSETATTSVSNSKNALILWKKEIRSFGNRQERIKSFLPFRITLSNICHIMQS